jgi:hypothetical protein
MAMRASLRLALAALVSLAAGSAAHARDPVVREMFDGTAVWHQSVCDHALSAGTMRCHSQMRTDAAGTPLQHAAAVTAATPNGYGPADLHSAYNIPTPATGSSSVTMAIVDAYGAAFPATAPGTIAVGGTSPVRSSTARGWTESVWYTSSTEGTGCGRRMESDISAVADPATGVAVYGPTGWGTPNGLTALHCTDPVFGLAPPRGCPMMGARAVVASIHHLVIPRA